MSEAGKASRALKAGNWLGIDIGSSRKKVCSFCCIASDGTGGVKVFFEQGPAGGGYPESNKKSALVADQRAPTYLKEGVESAVHEVLNTSELVRSWFEALGSRRSAIAIDAPVALAKKGKGRLTEAKSSQTIKTPDRDIFEDELRTKGDDYLRINNFWKCIGFAVYRIFAHRLEPCAGALSQPEIAAWTSTDRTSDWRLRETFPSDVYKRANGTEGTLASEGQNVLAALVAKGVNWVPAGAEGCRPVSQTLKRLCDARDFLRFDLAAGGRLCEMRKRSGTFGDLWDAFTCAFTACCEDHHATVLHGAGETSPESQDILRSEGAILTVKSHPRQS